jgi:uncharacterized protein (DUF1778 family)
MDCVNTYVLTRNAASTNFSSAMAKTAQLQIRVTPAEKARLKRLAAAAGLEMSAYVLARVLPREDDAFEAILRRLARGEEYRYVLAELHDFLVDLAPMQFGHAVSQPIGAALPPLLRNYVAAMVEHAAASKGIRPPTWVDDVAPLDDPYFAVPLPSLRLHLLRSAPVAFKRRNLFVDAAVGDRV